MNGGLPGLLNLIGHAAAHIEDQANENGNVFAGESGDFLFNAVFVDLEIFLVQPRDQAAIRIRDGDVDKGHLHVHLDTG